MKQRTITALFLIAILVPLVLIDHVIAEYGFIIIGVFLSTFGTYELINMMEKESNSLKIFKIIVPVFSGILTILACLATKKGNMDIDLLNEYFIYHFYVIIAYILFVAIILGAIIFVKNTTTKELFGCVASLTYAGLLFGYVLSIRFLDPIEINKGIIELNGIKSFSYIYLVVIANDLFAYLIGCKWGKKKLCPDISPKKSVEGAVAGLVAGTIIGTATLFNANIVNPSGTKEIIIAIVLGVILSIFLSITVQVGDLIASKIKRGYQIKDYSNIFPGHGGVLDRFDSLIYAGIWFYIIIQLFEILSIGF